MQGKARISEADPPESPSDSDMRELERRCKRRESGKAEAEAEERQEQMEVGLVLSTLTRRKASRKQDRTPRAGLE